MSAAGKQLAGLPHLCCARNITIGGLCNGAEGCLAPALPCPALLQVEQLLKLSRFLAGLHGDRSRKAASDAMNFVSEQVGSMPLLEDRLVAVVEAAQVRGAMNGHG